MIRDEGTSSFENGSLFTDLKENATLITHFGSMYIKFDEYPPFNGAIPEMFETIMSANIQCYHGYTYSSSREKICTCIDEEILKLMQFFSLIKIK